MYRRDLDTVAQASLLCVHPPRESDIFWLQSCTVVGSGDVLDCFNITLLFAHVLSQESFKPLEYVKEKSVCPGPLAVFILPCYYKQGSDICTLPDLQERKGMEKFGQTINSITTWLDCKEFRSTVLRHAWLHYTVQ